jgi:tetratricopeptide (TPR) repeat protein
MVVQEAVVNRFCKLLILIFSAGIIFSCNNKANQLGKAVQSLYESYENEEPGRNFPAELEEALKTDLNLGKLEEEAREIMNYYSKEELFHEYLGMLLMDKGYYRKAMTHFEKAILIRPKSSSLFYQYAICAGQVYSSLKPKSSDQPVLPSASQYLDIAERAYQKAIELKEIKMTGEKNFKARYGLAVIYYYERKNPEKALEVLEVVIKALKESRREVPLQNRYRLLYVYALGSTGNLEKANSYGQALLKDLENENYIESLNEYLFELEKDISRRQGRLFN